MNLLYSEKDLSNEEFYKSLEGNNTYNDLLNLLKHYEYIYLKNKRFLFVARVKFAKKYTKEIFNKEYNELNIYERIVITYFIFCKSVTQSYFCFQSESNYNIFKKYTIDELFYLEKNILDCYSKNKNKIWSVLKGKKIKINKKTNEHPMMPIGTNDYFCYLKKKKIIYDKNSIENIKKELNNKLKSKELIIEDKNKKYNSLTNKVNKLLIFENDDPVLISEKINNNLSNFILLLKEKKYNEFAIQKIGIKLEELTNIFNEEIDYRDNEEKIFDSFLLNK